MVAFSFAGIGVAAQIAGIGGGNTVSAAPKDKKDKKADKKDKEAETSGCDGSNSNGLSPDCSTTKAYEKTTTGDPAAKAAKTPCTSENCDLVKKYVNPLINMLSAAVGIVVIIAIIYGGIQYTTSEGDPQKAAKARLHITNAIIALIAFMFLYAFLQWIVPGGVLH